MARPEIDDEVIARLDRLIDYYDSVPLSPGDFSTNKKVELLVEEMEEQVINADGSAAFVEYDLDDYS